MYNMVSTQCDPVVGVNSQVGCLQVVIAKQVDAIV